MAQFPTGSRAVGLKSQEASSSQQVVEPPLTGVGVSADPLTLRGFTFQLITLGF